MLLVILLDFKNYANTEKEAETPACCGALAVAQTSWWTNCSFCRATTDPLQEIEWSSLKRFWIPSQAQESHGRSVQTTLAMPLVQEAQQAPCQRLRILLSAVGEMHRHPLRAWTEESNCGSATFEFQKEVAAVSGLGEMGELGRLAAKTVRHPQTGLCAISEKAHKGQKEPKGQAQGANGAIWSTFTGSTLAVNCAGSFASACCDWECIISRRPSATRTCSSDRNLRQANLLRSSDGDGEGQESPGTTTTDCEVSSAGVGQVGEEEKTTPTSASGKSESPSILGSIYIEESVKRWRTFAEDFGKKDQNLEQKVVEAKEAMQEAKEKYDNARAAMEKQDLAQLELQDVEEISDGMEEDVPEKIASSEAIQEGISSMLSTLDSIKVRPQEETMEAPLKKPRVEHGEDAGERSSPGVSALTPFHKPGK